MIKLFLGAICISFAPIFVKLVSTAPTATGFYRCAFAALFLLPILNLKSSPIKKAPFKLYLLLTFAGFLFCIDLYVWHRAVVYAGAGMGTILGNTQVFYTAAIGIVFLKEAFSLRFGASILIAFAGVYLLTSFHADFDPQKAEQYWKGVFFGLSTGLVYASYLAIWRKAGFIEGLNQRTRLLIVCVVSALCLLIISLLEGTLHFPSIQDLTYLIGLAFIAQVLGWLIITKNLPKVPMSRAGLILLTQPALAALMGNLFLNEKLTILQIIGSALIFAGIYLDTAKKH